MSADGDGESADSDRVDDALVAAAADAAEDVLFSRLDRTRIDDLDVTVRFEDGVLDVDVYVDAPETPDADVQQAVDDAALAAQSVADRRLREEEE